MNSKKESRLRRSRKTRAKIKELGVARLSVFRTAKHIYAQVISPCGKYVVVSASTLDPEVRAEIKYSGNIDAASAVGKIVAKRSVAKGVSEVAFDRSGFKFHGRIKALADSAREAGLQF